MDQRVLALARHEARDAYDDRTIAEAVAISHRRTVDVGPKRVGVHAGRQLRELGAVVALDDETAFDSFSAASAFAATQLDLLATVEAWLAGRGVPAPDASAYVRELIRGLSDALAEEPDRELALLASDHATPGGLNEQVRTYVRSHGVHELVATALDDVARRVAAPRN